MSSCPFIRAKDESACSFIRAKDESAGAETLASEQAATSVQGINSLPATTVPSAQQGGSCPAVASEETTCVPDPASLYEAVFRASNDALVSIDTAGRIILVNEIACQVFQYSKQELIGQKVNMLMTDDVASQHDGYLHNYYATGVGKVIGSGRKVQAKRKDNSVFTAKLSIGEAWSASGNRYFNAFLQDISIEEAAVQQAAASAEITRGILDAALDAIIAINAHGIVQSVNPAFTRAFGYQPNEIIGENVSVLMRERDAEMHDQHLERYARTRRPHLVGIRTDYPVEARRKDGSIFSAELSVSETTVLGKVVFTGFLRDCSVRKRLLEQEATAQARDRFFANMSHELRTPVNGIIGFADLMVEELARAKSGAEAAASAAAATTECPAAATTTAAAAAAATSTDDETSRHHTCQRLCEYANSIRVSGATLLDIVDDVLTVSKMDAGKITLGKNVVLTEKLLGDVDIIMQPAASCKQVSLTIQADADVPDMLVADPLRLKQVLLNLLSNAVKFTESGGSTTLKVQRKPLPVDRLGQTPFTTINPDDLPAGFITSACEVIFAVSDTGIGISESDQLRVFEAFEQGNTSSVKQFQGTGLGLDISRRLALMWGGNITVQSQLGHGSCFQFSLPTLGFAKQPGADANLTEHTISEASGSASASTSSSQSPAGLVDSEVDESMMDRLKTLKVMIVDDNEMNRRLLQRQLATMSIDVVAISGNGFEAVDTVVSAAETGHGIPDLILMDVRMPLMDGHTATSQILKHFKCADIQAPTIIGLSANGFPEDYQTALKSGMACYLVKPCRLPVLRKTLLRYC